MPSSKPEMRFVIDEDFLKDIEDFRYKYRFASRAEAMKWLMRWALDQKAVPPPKRKDEDY